MRDNLKHLPVNWINGMKINKDHFIAQDDACKDALNDVAALNVSSIRYGILPASAGAENTFEVKTSFDNQHTLRVSVLACNAITPGGVRIILPSLSRQDQQNADGVPATAFTFSPSATENKWWIVLIVNPFERQPAGSPDTDETPPRFPFVIPAYKVQVISDSQFPQYAYNPYALIIGKVNVTQNEVLIDDNYIPPCFSLNAHPDLISLFSEIDQFMGSMETRCSQIVQKIFRKNQQNEISELVMFLCDRIVLYVGQAITHLRWTALHESPVALFTVVVNLARVMKNSVDMRTGSGKEEMMNYLCEWCELKQGELESLLTGTSNLRYDNNDINKNIDKVVSFAKVTSKLFDTLSKLDFIGKRKDTGIFVKEESIETMEAQSKGRRRFFG